MKPGDKAVFAGDLVALGELRGGLDLPLHFMQLAGQRANAHDGLQLVAEGAWVDLYAVAFQHPSFLQFAQPFRHAWRGQAADLRERLERAARVLHQRIDQLLVFFIGHARSKGVFENSP